MTTEARIVDPPRPRRRANRVAFQTILKKELARFLRIWLQTILPSAITMTLYFIIFGSLIGARIGEMGGFSYMQYIAPGIIMMAVITNSYSNVVSSFFGGEISASRRGDPRCPGP